MDSTAQGGAQIKFVTKSGTNQFHGGGFYQVRNTLLRRQLLLQQPGRACRATSSSCGQYGGHIGGPIMKNKLFFFGNLEVVPQPRHQRVHAQRLDAIARTAATTPTPTPPARCTT